MSEADARAVVRQYVAAVDEVMYVGDPDGWEEYLRAEYLPRLMESSRNGTPAETDRPR